MKKLRWLFRSAGFDSKKFVKFCRGLPSFLADLRKFRAADLGEFKTGRYYPVIGENLESAGSVPLHYFHQDVFFARKVNEANPTVHVDIGSRIDGFIGHLLVFRSVTIVDVRPLKTPVLGIQFVQGIAEKLDEFETSSLYSLSCLHAFEHFGLGRYGDPFNLDAIYRAAAEFCRVLGPEGLLYISVPISGESRIEFNAHRVFSPDLMVKIFGELELVGSHCVTDKNVLIENAGFDIMKDQHYGCGMFIFRKRGAVAAD